MCSARAARTRRRTAGVTCRGVVPMLGGRPRRRCGGRNPWVYALAVAAGNLVASSNVTTSNLVVTNKAEAFTLPLLATMGLAEHFEVVVSGDTLPVRKPDPAVLHHACALLGVQPHEALMVGDSANDALAARAAGMPVMLVSYGYSEGLAVDTLECDGLLSNTLQMLDHLAAERACDSPG